MFEGKDVDVLGEAWFTFRLDQGRAEAAEKDEQDPSLVALAVIIEAIQAGQERWELESRLHALLIENNPGMPAYAEEYAKATLRTLLDKLYLQFGRTPA